MRNPRDIQTNIEARLEQLEPDVEVVALEQIAAERLRLTIDRADGVDLALCERVTKHLPDLLAEYALEVSSPGPERPLAKPDHYRRFLGRRAKVRTRVPVGGQKSFTGELVGASDDEVVVAVPTKGAGAASHPAVAVVSIPYSEINRSNLVEEGR